MVGKNALPVSKPYQQVYLRHIQQYTLRTVDACSQLIAGGREGNKEVSQ